MSQGSTARRRGHGLRRLRGTHTAVEFYVKWSYRVPPRRVVVKCKAQCLLLNGSAGCPATVPWGRGLALLGAGCDSWPLAPVASGKASYSETGKRASPRPLKKVDGLTELLTSFLHFTHSR